MKKKLLSIVLAICMLIACAFVMTACTKPKDPEGSIDYTVSEAEWKINFNLTKPQTQPLSSKGSSQAKPFSTAFSNTLTAITSYTLYAEGVSGGLEGTSLLKVAPNAMSIDFYIGTVHEDESGIYQNTDTLYQTLTYNILQYFPFANNYNDFTFDETINAYVCQELTSIMVDDYDPTQQRPVYSKDVKVSFVNGYLKTIELIITDASFTDNQASFVFTFSNINKTTVNV